MVLQKYEIDVILYLDLVFITLGCFYKLFMFMD